MVLVRVNVGVFDVLADHSTFSHPRSCILRSALYHTIINVVIFNLKIPIIPGLWLIYLLLELLLVLVIVWHFGPRHLSISRENVLYTIVLQE